MAKKIAINVCDEANSYLEENFVNKSAFINALILKHISMKSGIIHTDLKVGEEEIKEFDEVFDAQRTD